MKTLLPCLLLIYGCSELPLIDETIELHLSIQDPLVLTSKATPVDFFSQLTRPKYTAHQHSQATPTLSAGIMVYFTRLTPLSTNSSAWSPLRSVQNIRSLYGVAFSHEFDTANKVIRLPVDYYDIYAIGYSGVSSQLGQEIASENVQQKCFRWHHVNISTLSQLAIPLQMKVNITQSMMDNLFAANMPSTGCEFGTATELKSPFSHPFKERTIPPGPDDENDWPATEFSLCATTDPVFLGKQVASPTDTGTYLRDSLEHQDLFVSEWTDQNLTSLRDSLDDPGHCNEGTGKSIFVSMSNIGYEKDKESPVTFMQGPRVGKCLNFQTTGYTDNIRLPIGSYTLEGQTVVVPITIDVFDAPGCPANASPTARYFLKNGLIHSEKDALAWTGASLTALLNPSNAGNVPANIVGQMRLADNETKRLMVFLRQNGLENQSPISANHRVYLRDIQ